MIGEGQGCHIVCIHCLKAVSIGSSSSIVSFLCGMLSFVFFLIVCSFSVVVFRFLV
jgi:hypothetical protein